MPVATLGAVAVAAAVASGAPVPVAVSLGLSIVGYKLTSSFLSSSFVREAFIKARLVGVDLNKPTTKRDAAGNLVRPVDGALVPEAAGVLAGTVYLVCMFVFIPVRFSPSPSPNLTLTLTPTPTLTLTLTLTLTFTLTPALARCLSCTDRAPGAAWRETAAAGALPAPRRVAARARRRTARSLSRT